MAHTAKDATKERTTGDTNDFFLKVPQSYVSEIKWLANNRLKIS
jgi:hypothetical protein